MSVDFQVVFPVEVVKLNALRLVVEGDSPLLDIQGQDFRAVDDVVINDMSSPGWHVVSKTRLLAELPGAVSAAAITSVHVTSRNLVLTERSILKFRVSERPAKVVGILRLVQLYVKLMLTTPGADIYNPNVGGGILRFLGSTAYGSEGGDLVRRFVIANDQVARQIIAIQSRQPSLPPDEKLLAAKVLSARFSASQSALMATTEITTQAGRSAATNLVF